MILLTSTSDLVKIITASALNMDVACSYVDLDTSAASTQIPVPGRTLSLITTATTTTTIVPALTGTFKRSIKTLSIYNRDASASNLTTVQLYDGTNNIDVVKVTILAGETLSYDEGKGWSVINATGQIKQVVQTSGQYVGATLVTSASANFTTGATTNKIKIKGVGGGGGGGGCTSVASAAAGAGGGGAGSYAEKTFAVSPGTAYAYTCGAQGNGASGALGGAGTDSTFVVGATTVTAKGGTGGPVATAANALGAFAGGAGGIVGTNGDVNAPGQDGSPGSVLVVATPAGIGARGGDSPFGKGGQAVVAAAAGNAASGNGAGGGGALTGASSARAGGNGTAGCWLVEEYT